MIFIIIVSISIYFVLLAWTWKSLDEIEITKKIIFIIIGIFILYLLTQFIFSISQNSIIYDNENIKKSIQNMLVGIFTGINGIIALPQIAKIIKKVKENEIEKNQIIKRIILILAIFIICLIFENGYMKNTQEGILEIYNAIKK